jgi:ammonia channel protein AmtB
MSLSSDPLVPRQLGPPDLPPVLPPGPPLSPRNQEKAHAMGLTSATGLVVGSIVVLGAGILWFGWFGFNAGSALAANAFTVTQIAAATGFLVWAVLEHSRTGKTTLTGLTTGAVAGLATITPAAGCVGPPMASAGSPECSRSAQ